MTNVGVPTGYLLPVPSTDLTAPVQLLDTGAAVTVSFSFVLAGEPQTHILRFEKVRAYRHTQEVHCTDEQIEGAYDLLAEVQDSSWAQQIRRDTNAQWRDYWKLRHFRIFADSNGCYEFLAESWAIDRVEN